MFCAAPLSERTPFEAVKEPCDSVVTTLDVEHVFAAKLTGRPLPGLSAVQTPAVRTRSVLTPNRLVATVAGGRPGLICSEMVML